MRTSAVKGTVDPNVFGDWTKFGKGEVVKKMMKVGPSFLVLGSLSGRNWAYDFSGYGL